MSVSCTRWSDYLIELSRLANAARALVDCAGEYSTGDSSVADIRTFIQSKIALDVSLKKFTALHEEEAATDWPSYLANAKRRVGAGTELVRLLKPCGKPGTSARAVLDGLDATKRATDLISGIGNDISLMNVLQEVFRGYETDLGSLASTVSWSESVAGSIPIRGSPLYSFLLSCEARADLHWAKDTLEKITNLGHKLKTTLSNLADFGSFSWDEWSFFGGNQSKDEFATHLLKRNESAACNIDSVLAWSKYNAQRLTCQKSGLGDFVHAIEQNKLPTSICGKAFRVARRTLDQRLVLRHTRCLRISRRRVVLRVNRDYRFA